MSGHSKWATTKHKKAAIDAKRGKLFAKLIKNIEIAARMGGGDPDGNPSLYDAIYKAKKASMPADNIKRAVKRGSGEEAGGANYEDIVYEGYAPAGCGLLHGAFHMQVGVVRRGEDLQALGCGIAVEADHERLRCVQLLERLQDALGDLLA